MHPFPMMKSDKPIFLLLAGHSYHIFRKTQFNNTLNKHNTSVSAYCDWCLKIMNKEVKESLVHALWDCPKISSLYENVLKALNIDHLTQLPLSAQQVILYDSFATASTLINKLWLILICIILNHKYDNAPISLNITCAKIRETNRAFPKSNLSIKWKNLSLREFLASHEATGIHWTTHKTSANLQP